MKYRAITTRITVLPEKAPLFSELATHIEIKDEAHGAFVNIAQFNPVCELGVVRICKDEWEAIKLAINSMLETCEILNGETK